MIHKPDSMHRILEELKEQCLKVASLIDSYDLENKSEDEKDALIVDMSLNLSILATRSTLIDGYFDEIISEEETPSLSVTKNN
jgi:broad-specificity NMP kinase